MRADREAAIAERTAMLERLASLPLAMRERPQWLLWKFEQHEGEAKPRKMPYYCSGRRRTGKQGDEADRAALIGFDAAVARLRMATIFSGLGFAFLPGDGLIGVDIDGAIDPATGEVSELCSKVIELCASYTERSPSGKGVHIIMAGETNTAKDNGIGLEMFCKSQYFTCTGSWWPGAPREVRAADPHTVAYLHEEIELAKAAAKARVQEARAVSAPLAAAAAAAALPVSAGERHQTALALPPGDDFKRVNDAALRALGAWVPELFPAARAHTGTGGYRITSKELGRDLQEDLSITPQGIMDFGRELGYTAIDLVIEWSTLKAPKDALHWLAARIGVDVKKRGLRLVPARAPEPPPEGEPAGLDDAPQPPPEGDEGNAKPPTRRRRASSAKSSHTPPDGEGGGLTRLAAQFRLIYGTDAVWDGEQRITMAVKNLRLIFGNDAVKMWLGSPDRQVVMQHDMVFEPGSEVAAHQVNLYDGAQMVPEPCEDAEVAVMLELLRHLCSGTSTTEEGVSDVMDWVLKWLAYPLQNVGAKMRTALVFHGPQGTGKNLFFDGYRSMFGKYGRMVGQTELDDKFNDWLSAKQLIIGNEVVTRQELFHNKNKLKWIITEPEIPIRGMHQAVRWESNHAQVVFLSNEHQPIALEKDDRRHVVVYTPVAGDEDLYLRVSDFIARGGAAKFMHYLLRYETQGFNEHTKPIMTEAKAALIELSLKPAERFINEWLQGLLPLPLHPCSAEQLYRVFRRWADMTGERFPPPQAQFTRTAERHVLERVQHHPDTKAKLPPKLTYKIVMLKHEVGPRKAVRCWLPRGTAPPEGVTEGEWVASAVDSFEAHSARYGRAAQHEEQP